MIDLKELNKAWADIIQNQECKTKTEKMNYARAIQNGKKVIKDVSESDMLELPVEILQMITRINKLYLMLSDSKKI